MPAGTSLVAFAYRVTVQMRTCMQAWRSYGLTTKTQRNARVLGQLAFFE